MKPRPYSPFVTLRQLCLASAVTIAVTSSSLNAQTAEIDPAGAIPSGFSLAQGWEWATDGAAEGWAGTNATATVAAGEVAATSTTIDPQWAIAAALTTPIPVYRDVVIEARVKRASADTTPLELFWADIGGGFGAVRSTTVAGAAPLDDGAYHVVRITYTGQIGTKITQLRLEPTQLNTSAFTIDYVRVYTNGGLLWDTGIVPGGQGGAGPWGALPTFWNGSANVAWPTSGTENAVAFPLPVGTVTIDAAGVAANVLSFPTENIDKATGYTLAADPGGKLTLNGTNPTIFVTGDTTLTAPLAGTAGLIKKGHRVLYLGGDNSALSGNLSIDGFPGGINAGVVLTSDTAIGGMATVNINGNATYGGFLQLDGGRTLGAGVTTNVNSTGGATASFPPGAIRSTGVGAVNTIQGPINVTLSQARISNNDAKRLDLTGPISAGGNTVIFRNAGNEGIHVINTGNAWTGQTQHHEGTVWFEPNTLPAGSNLSIGGSAAGTVQFNGTFNRPLGTAGGQVQFTLNAGRAMGFGARGGDLTINFGGAAAEVSFDTTATTAPATAIRTSTLALNGSTADSKITVANPLNLNGAARTIQVSTNTAELSGGVRGGTFTLTKTGAGSLLLPAASTWTGDLTLANNAGVVRLGHNEALGAPDTAKSVNTTGSNQIVGILELPGGLSIDDNKTLKMGGKVFYTDAVTAIGDQSALRNIGTNTWAGSALIATAGGSYGIESVSGTLTLGTGPATTKLMRNEVATTGIRTLSWFGAGDVVMNLQMADNSTFDFNFIKVGSGKLSITRGDNTFDQAPNLRSGITEVVKLADSGTASSLGTGSVGANINVGGTLRYLGSGDSCNRTIGILQTGATLDSSGTGPLVLSSATLSHQTGTGTTVCAPFALGATTLNVNDPSGIAVGQTIAATNIPTGATVTSVNVDTRTLGISQATTAASTTGLTTTLTGASTIDRTLTLTGDNTGDNIFAAALSNPGTGKLGITKTGNGKWILSGATKTNTGLIDVQAGTLGFANSLPPAFAPTVAAAATLSLKNVTLPTGSPALDIDGALDIAGPVKVVVPASSVVPGTIAGVLEYGSLTGAANLTSDYRNGSFTDAGTSATLNVAAGIGLTWTGAGGAAWDINTTTSWKDGSDNPEKFFQADSVAFGEAGALVQPNVTLTGELRPVAVAVSSTTDYSFTGAGFISGTASLIKSGAAKLTIATNNTNSGNTTIQAGTVEVGNGGATGAIGTGNVTNDGGLAFNRTGTYQYDGTIAGNGGVTQLGTGTTILTAGHSCAGTTTVTAGTLQIGTQAAPVAFPSGTITLTTPGILRFNRGDTSAVVDMTQISGSGTLAFGQTAATSPTNTWGSLATLTGSNAAFTGNIVVDSGGLKITDAAALGTGPKNIQITNGTAGRPQFYLDGSGGNITIPAGFNFVTSSTQLTHPAIGNLAGDNVIEGTLSLVSGGGNSAVSVLGGSLTLNGGISNGLTNRELILGGNVGTTGTVNGLIANGPDAFRVTKSEANTWTFTSANTYTGTTTVSGGLLLINGDQTAATGNVTVNTGGTLGGIGKVGGVLRVNTGGTLAPGGSPGTLTAITNTIIDGTLAIEVNDTATDKLVVGGTLDIGGATLTVSPTGAGLTQPAYVIAEASAPIVGSFAVTNLPTGYIVVVGYNDGVDTNNIAVVQGVADPYLGWADTKGLTGGNRAPSADPDNDGLENGIEFVIGSDPNANTPLADRPGATVIGGNLVFTFKRSDESEAFNVYVEHGTNLVDWPGSIAIPVVDTDGPPVDVADNGAVTSDDVTVTIPMGTDLKKFARLRADIPFTP